MDTSEPRPLPRAVRPPVFAKAKFLAPQPRSTQVSRPALVEYLQRTDDVPLTIVVGSPGSGKTSLLADWYRHVDDGSVAWLSADRSDQEPMRFWRAFIVAVQQVEPSFGVEAADLMTLDGHVSADVLESVSNDDAELTDRVRLVIDDFHLVSLAAAQQLQHLLERGLQHLRIVIGSRSDPAVGLHRLRVQRQVAEVREHDLRLTLDETAAVLAALGLEPTSVDVVAIHERTEGWAAGVQMATLSVVGADDPASRVQELTGTTQTIAGYFADEVVANQTPRMQRFLEHTCVVDELDPAMAEALDPGADDGTARVALHEVEAANLMLTRIDGAGTSFRYHQLFAEMLRNRLQARDPQMFREQHRLAAEHLLQRGDIADAVGHFWQAGMSSRGAQLLREQTVQVYLDSSAPPSVDASLLPPDDALRLAPADATGYSVGLLLNGRIATAVSLLERAEAYAIHDGAPPVDLVHLAAARIAAHLASGDTRQAVASTERLVALVAEHDLPTSDDWVSIAIPFGIRAATWEGDLGLADRLVKVIPDHPDQRLTLVDNAAALALLEVERGDFITALGHATRAHEAALELGDADSGADSAARIMMGAALLEQARYEEADNELRAGVHRIGDERVPSQVLARISEARLMRAQGNFDAALRTLAQLRTQVGAPSTAPTFATRINLAELTIRLALGEFDAATALLGGIAPGFRLDQACAWVALLQNRTGDVDEFRNRLADSASNRREQLGVALLDLRIALQRNDADAADGAAATVLDVAEPSGAILIIAEAGASVLHATVSAAKRRTRTPFIERLLAVQPLPRPAEQHRRTHRFEELSSRELIVLRYMVTSMTNQEIADALYLSVNTVKTHIKHVLRKLGAASRVEAAKRAQELHYL